MRRHWRSGVGIIGVITLIFFYSALGHALTPANTLISNQATASYVDADGVGRLSSSNAVRTRVQTVASFILLQDNQKQGLPGHRVRFNHLITNTGNADDQFQFSIVNQGNDDFDLINMAIYADVDANGIADNDTALNETPIIAMGQSYTFIIEADIPSNSAIDTASQITLTAVSNYDNQVIATNVDRLVLVDDAIIDISQSIGQTQGESGSGSYTIQLDYINRGTRAAQSVELRYSLPDIFIYRSNQAIWSQGQIGLTDSDEESQGQTPAIIYCAYDNFTCDEADSVRFIIDEVGAGQSGTIEFQIDVAQTAIPGTYFSAPVFDYQKQSGLVIRDNEVNTVPFTVLANRSVLLTDAAQINVAPGTTVNLIHTVTNTGNAADTFNISWDSDNSTFPEGTAYFFYQVDGVTPLNDSNLDNLIDSSELAAGGSLSFALAITLPANALSGTYNVPLTATSISASEIEDQGNSTVTVVAPTLAVDMTTIAASGDTGCSSLADVCDFGAFDDQQPAVVNLSLLPGESLEATIYVKNLSDIADAFDLALFNDSQGQQPVTDLTVQYQWPDNTINSSTGTLTSQQSIAIRVTFSLNGQALPSASRHLYLRALSQASGQSDQIAIALIVEGIERLTFSPDYQVTEKPNSQGIYQHVIRNEGSELERIDQITLLPNASSPWSAILYRDTAGGIQGQWDASDEVYQGTTDLAPNESLTLFLWVFIPSDAGTGESQQFILTASYNDGSRQIQVVDDISANPYDVDIQKLQALDQDCDGVNDNPFDESVFLAGPGECIIYAVSVHNAADITALNAAINDATPDFTHYAAIQPAVSCQPAVCQITQVPDVLGVGDIIVTIGDLNPNDRVTFYFSVRVDNE